MQIQLLQDFVVPRGTILKMYDNLEVTYPVGISNERTEIPFGTLIVGEHEIKSNPEMYEIIQSQDNHHKQTEPSVTQGNLCEFR